jgi:glutamate-5-semialdehyde dehydrogenase
MRKNAALHAMAARLADRQDEIVSANQRDLEAARASDLPEKLVARLGFDKTKISARIAALERIAALQDPVGTAHGVELRPNGLAVARVRVPLGVIVMIYEARPHVTVNAGAFCLKAGNSAILRGGSEAAQCNALLGQMWRESLAEADLPAEAIQVVFGSHDDVSELIRLEDLIDLVIPRGGKELIRAVTSQSRVPVLKHSSGVCHVYLDEGADLEQGMRLVLDSKCLMPEVCNAMETLLVCEKLEPRLPEVAEAFQAHGVTIRGCQRTTAAVRFAEPATEEDWRTEYLDSVVAVRVVRGIDEAIEHVNRYGSHHTDAIVTESRSRARRFVGEVDSAVVLVNASTMFCDGASLGMGAEIGISTDRLHARGPMGLGDLTTYKFVIEGDGQVMGAPEDWRTKVKP